MSVQPAFSILEAIVGTRPAGAAPAAGAPQNPFASLLAVLIGPASVSAQPRAAGAVAGQLRASHGPDEATSTQAAGGTSIEPDAGFLAPDLPAATATAPGVTPTGDVPLQAVAIAPHDGRSAAGVTRSMDGLGPELSAPRQRPAPAFDVARTPAASPAGQEAGAAPGKPVASQAIPVPAPRPEASPATEPGGVPQLAGLDPLPELSAAQPRPAPAFAAPRTPAAPRQEPGAAPGRLMGPQVIPGSPARPQASPLSDPSARQALLPRGGVGESLPDSGAGPSVQLEPGEMVPARSDRFSPAPASLPARSGSEGVAGQIGIQIVRAASRELRQVVVQLEPAELGRVHIRLEFAGHGAMKAVIGAERPETLELLQRDAPALERSLQEAGLRLDSGGIGFSLRRERGQNGRDDSAGAHGAAQVSDTPSSSLAGTAPPDPLALTVRLLDIHA